MNKCRLLECKNQTEYEYCVECANSTLQILRAQMDRHYEIMGRDEWRIKALEKIDVQHQEIIRDLESRNRVLSRL